MSVTDGDVESDDDSVISETFQVSDEVIKEFRETQAEVNKSLSRSLNIPKIPRIKLPRVEDSYSLPEMDARPWVEAQVERKRKIKAVAEDINQQVEIREAKEIQREKLETKRFRWSLAISIMALMVATIAAVFAALTYFQ